ncbi:hypothetical protein [Loktanella sp. S4079]|uniref:hypothetical protein n=1 Tax=Loktanella sp. S4079 TaxID=579483 RepID=UPI0005F9DA31|nr:hypothetical protein [Loktanella sp. S4079]KJZ18982.1 hypothetical protein TW80_13000 [Loktanella sp. S4079]
MVFSTDSISGKLIVAIVAPLVVGAVGFLAGRIVAEAPALEIVISPTNANVSAGRIVEFSAEGSLDPSGYPLEFAWTVGGLPLGQSSMAGCSPTANGVLLSCQFVMPGNAAVAVTAMSRDGRVGTVAATVTVELQDGYFAMIAVDGGSEIDSVYRDLLNALDWPTLQAQVRTPILVFDPDQRIALPAASIRPDPSRVGDALEGTKIMVPLTPGSEPFGLVRGALEPLGATLVAVPHDQIGASLESGLGEIGLTLVSSPTSFLDRVLD